MSDGSAEIGLTSFLTKYPGCGGKLRTEFEDFRVIELGEVTPGTGNFWAQRVELRNWETNRFASQACRVIGLRRNEIGFSGMKDKRAVTEQFFSFACAPERIEKLRELQDVRLLGEPQQIRKALFPGDHTGNRFVLRVREHNGNLEDLPAIAETINSQGGVPNFFGPQRFGAGVRPITTRMGLSILAGDLEEAVRIYVGEPMAEEKQEVAAARRMYDETRDPAKTLEMYPRHLNSEQDMLKRLIDRPGNFPAALRALPHNLLQLFVHAVQSWAFNHILAERLDLGWGLRPRIGDVVQADGERDRMTVVDESNLEWISAQYDLGRLHVTAPLTGYDTTFAQGDVGELEHRVLKRLGYDADSFRCAAWPSLKSKGERRSIRMPVTDLDVQTFEEDPVVGFSLGKGGYATIVMREFMKSSLDCY